MDGKAETKKPTKTKKSLPKRDVVAYASEWNYPMRRDMQEILPGLFLGPYACAAKNKLPHLRSHGITHIICIRHVMEQKIIKPNFPDLFMYLVLDISDSYDQSIIPYLQLTRDFIDEAFQAQGKVLVHGNGGISRSGAIVIGYVMEKYEVPYKDAFEHVQSKRFCVNPNVFFAQQLEEYEPIFRARLLNPEPSDPVSSVGATQPQTKRKHEDEDTSMDTDPD